MRRDLIVQLFIIIRLIAELVRLLIEWLLL